MMPIRILIAEDDRRIAEIQRRFLERLNGELLIDLSIELCGIAHTLADARDQIEVLQPDLVLLDVWFPDGSGLELLKEMRASGSATDVILITAAKEVDTLRSALRGGVFDYILKPLVYERLGDALRRFSRHLATLDSLQNIEQCAVDALMPGSRPETEVYTVAISQAGPVAGGQRLPKGIDGLTLEKFRLALTRQSEWTAESAGADLGASRTTARRYLEYLVGEGELSAEVSYGSVGRPERHYFRRGRGK